MQARRIQAGPQAHGAGFYDERRGCDGGGEVREAAAQAVVERRLEVLLGAVGGVTEQLFDVGIEGDRGSHKGIMMLPFLGCQDAGG